MPDDNKPDEMAATDPLKALPEDLGLGDEIRRISRKVNRIMKRVEAANDAVRTIIAPEAATKSIGEEAGTASNTNSEESPHTS